MFPDLTGFRRPPPSPSALHHDLRLLDACSSSFHRAPHVTPHVTAQHGPPSGAALDRTTLAAAGGVVAQRHAEICAGAGPQGSAGPQLHSAWPREGWEEAFDGRVVQRDVVRSSRDF